MCIFILLGVFCPLSVLFVKNNAMSTHTSLLCKYSANFRLTKEKVFQVEFLETCMSQSSFMGGTDFGFFFSQYNAFLLGHTKERSIVSSCGGDQEAFAFQSPNWGKNLNGQIFY